MSECFSPFVQRAADRGVRVEQQVEDLQLETDADRLRMIVNNLIDNAVSYVDDQGTINITALRAGADLQLRITNTGSQIAPDQLPHLTQRFWRGDESRSNTGLHCGLGLSLCNRLAILIGGRLSIESSEGIFSATLILAGAPTVRGASVSNAAADSESLLETP